MKQIRILHTGGTIAMQMHDNKGIVKSNRSIFNLDIFNDQIPWLRDIADVVITSQALCDEVDPDKYEGGVRQKSPVRYPEVT